MIKKADGTSVVIRKSKVLLNKNPLIHEQRMQLIMDYMQGAVHSYTKNNPGKKFKAHTLFGGENANWEGTPLQFLYEARVRMGSPNPKKAAGQDVGWILLQVLHDDNRVYVKEKGRWATYKKVN